MDPITIGVGIGTVVIAQLSGKIMAKAVDPEFAAQAVNWVFDATNHFLKLRQDENSTKSRIAPPPEAKQSVQPSTESSDHVVEGKAQAVREIAQSLKNKANLETTPENGLELILHDAYSIAQLTSEVENTLNILSTYLENLQDLELEAAQYGGKVLAPPIVRNGIRIQQQEILKNVMRLNNAMKRAYGTSAPAIEELSSL